MPDPKPKMKKAFIIRDFNDAGTGASFTAGATPDIEEGTFENYKTGGLVRLATPAEVKAASGSADETNGKPAA